MTRLVRRLGLLILLAGAAPLVTVANCNRTPNGGGTFDLHSTNDHLVEDALDWLFDIDDDDD